MCQFAVPQEFSLSDAYQQALSRVESVAIEQARLAQSGERVSQAWGGILPSISLVGAYQRQDTSANSGGSDVAQRFTLADQFNARVNLTQPLFRGFAEYAALRGARAEVQAATAQKEQIKQSLFTSVADAFFSVLSNEQDEKNVKNLMELTTRRLKDLQERSRIGRSREGEVLAAEAQVAVLKSQLQAAQAAVVQSRDRLAFVTGLSRESVLVAPQENATPFSNLENLAHYLALSEKRPDLRVFKERLTAAEESIAVARAGHFPSIDATANYHLKRAGILDGIKWDVGISFSLPLFQGGVIQSRVREALQRKNEQELLLAQGRRNADTEIRNAYENVRTGREQVQALAQATQIAERNFKAQNQDYRLGLVTNLEVLQALNTFQETKRSLDRVRYQTWSAWAVLQSAVGQVI